LGIFEPIALAGRLQDVAAMGQPVQRRTREPLAAEHFGPLLEGQVRGEVLQIDPASGRVLKTYQTGSPIRYQPVVEGGRIYVGTQDGRLVCVDTGNKKFAGWSMWGRNAARTGIQEAVQ
jgi:outer membrane protein assembly factor BamB